jgi:site-specific DNA-cytosine methylase
MIVDLFAGGGGASLGIKLALHRDPDIAINHDIDAVAMHAMNHPNTKHFCQDVWKVVPTHATMGQPVDLLWASPDCKHFSKAQGFPDSYVIDVGADGRKLTKTAQVKMAGNSVPPDVVQALVDANWTWEIRKEAA